MRIDRQQAEWFKQKVGLPAMEICPRFGIDPAECIRQAAELSVFGKFAVHNNFFDIEEDGDLGHNVFIRIKRTGKVNNGGYEPVMYRRGKFSSPIAAIIAYCKIKIRG